MISFLQQIDYFEVLHCVGTSVKRLTARSSLLFTSKLGGWPLFIPISQRSKLRFIEVQPHGQYLSICKGEDLGFTPRPSGSKMCAHNHEVIPPLLDADLKNNFKMKHAKGDCLFSLMQKHSRAHRSMLFREEK